MKVLKLSLGWLVLLGFAMTVQAGAHKEVRPMVKVDVDSTVEEEVKAVVVETGKIWSSQDFAKILTQWDPNEPFPTYLGEEQEQWFVGWERLREYLDPGKPNPVVQAIRQDNFDIQVKQIAPDLAIAWWYMIFEMKIIGAKPFGEKIRASAVLRKTDDGWKYIHWAESPKNGKVYIEDLFEKDVRDDWDEFYEQAKKDKKEVWRKRRELEKQQKAAKN